jgi:hypothetical protein
VWCGGELSCNFSVVRSDRGGVRVSFFSVRMEGTGESDKSHDGANVFGNSGGGT